MTGGELKSVLTEDQVKKILDGAEEELRLAVIADVKEKISSTVTWIIDSELESMIRVFFKEEIAPDVREALLGKKPEVLKATVLAAADIAEELRKALVAEVIKNLSNDYNRRELLKKLFGG